MKKLVSIALALVMALGLASPAWAAEVTPEQIAEIAEKYGLEAPDATIQLPDGDFGYTVTDPEPLPERWWMDDVPAPEPTLALYVNGVATDVELTAGEGVTYADASALRQFFGPQAVPADKEGLLPIRETAEQAGWDVGWYASRWSGEQEVQLWDKATYEAYLADEFGPLNDFFAKALQVNGGSLFSDAPISTHQTAQVELTRFSTLDGDETYPLTLEADLTMGGGVLDATVTFDVSALLKAFPADALESLTKMGGFSVTQLKQFLKAGVMEFILDYNAGELAYNLPLLALADESLAGWQTQTLPGLDGVEEALEGLEGVSLTSTLYAQLTTTASYAGAEFAQGSYDTQVQLLTLFAGKDRFTVQNGKTTYSLTAQDVNEAISALIGGELDEEDGLDAAKRPVYAIFKAFEVTYTLDDGGNVTASVHIRPDTDGLANAIAKAYESSWLGDDPSAGALELVMGWVLTVYDMDFAATTQGNAQRSTGSVDVHWNNVGKVSVRSAATQTAPKAPRSIDDIVR